jgi:putative intracellular protease/amidase
MADWEYGFLLAELNSKRYFLPSKKNLEIITVSNDLNTKTSMGGFKITPDITINELDFSNEDFLILPGADKWLENENKEILIKSKEFINNDMNVAAICGAKCRFVANIGDVGTGEARCLRGQRVKVYVVG